MSEVAGFVVGFILAAAPGVVAALALLLWVHHTRDH
jgi:hypothetical protein